MLYRRNHPFVLLPSESIRAVVVNSGNANAATGDAGLRNTRRMAEIVADQLGCDPTAKKILVVKSAQHFHASFAKIAREVLYVGAPGAADPNYANLPYKKIRQPKWPIS